MRKKRRMMIRRRKVRKIGVMANMMMRIGMEMGETVVIVVAVRAGVAVRMVVKEAAVVVKGRVARKVAQETGKEMTLSILTPPKEATPPIVAYRTPLSDVGGYVLDAEVASWRK